MGRRKNVQLAGVASKHFEQTRIKELLREKEQELTTIRAQKEIWLTAEKKAMEELKELKSMHAQGFVSNQGLNHLNFPSLFERIKTKNDK